MTDSNEPIADQVKKDTGIDVDKIITEGIARKNIDAGEHKGEYPGDMETTAEQAIETNPELESEEVGRTLTLHDRCDSCGAAALGYATKDERDLLFCGHHLHKNEEALRNQGFEVFEVQQVS